MATLTFGIGIDMRTFAGYDFPAQESHGGSGSTGATTWRWDWSSGFTDIVTGVDMANSSGFFPSTGTVNGWELDFTDNVFNPADPFHSVVHTYNFWTFSGLSLPAADFSNAIQGDAATLAAYIPTMIAGDDRVNGSKFDDYLLGGGGNDVVSGGFGNDTLEGGSGTDTLNGGPGNDIMMGGFGSDTYVVDSILDQVIEDGSDGIDTVKSSVNFTLGDNVDRILLTGTGNINGTGNDLANILTGNSGNNLLRGAGGNDTIHGGAGNDTLAGGTGNDVLYGDAGADQFLFASTLDGSTNVDKIQDFSVADDTIALDDDVFTAAGAVGTLAASAFFAGGAAHDTSDRVIYNSATGNIYYDADGSGAGAQILIAHVTAGTALTNADFLVVG